MSLPGIPSEPGDRDELVEESRRLGDLRFPGVPMEAWDGRENLEVCDVTTADVELDVLDVGLFERRCVELMSHRVSGSHSQQLCGRRA